MLPLCALLACQSSGSELPAADERTCDAAYLLVDEDAGFAASAGALEGLSTDEVQDDAIRQAANRAKLVTGAFLDAEEGTPAKGELAQAVLFSVGEVIDACAAAYDR